MPEEIIIWSVEGVTGKYASYMREDEEVEYGDPFLHQFNLLIVLTPLFPNTCVDGVQHNNLVFQEIHRQMSYKLFYLHKCYMPILLTCALPVNLLLAHSTQTVCIITL